jgi:hypothetical protein
MALVPHAVAGLLAWLLARLFPYHPYQRTRPEPVVAGLGLRS